MLSIKDKQGGDGGSGIGHDRPMVGETLLEVDSLNVEFVTGTRTVRAVSDISLSLRAGETVALIGESGSGKTVTALALMGIVPSPPGVVTCNGIRFRDRDLQELTARERRRVRGEKIAMIFQDPLTSLNPVFTVAHQIGEMFRAHRGLARRAARRRAIELMDRVGIPDPHRRADHYPHQFSGGMRQRVMIAMALALEPSVLIADEPTTALDVTVQAQIMELLAGLQAENHMGMILITHDLGVVASVADRVHLMYAGRTVESGPASDFYAAPAHPYAQGLLESVPRLSGPLRLEPIRGSPPSLTEVVPGCAFNPRCPYTTERCRTEMPRLRPIEGYTGRVACHRAEDIRG